KTDGTPGGTSQVMNTGGPDPGSLTHVGGTLYFIATDAAGTHLWKTDGTVADTAIVDNVSPGASIVAIGDTLYYVKDAEVWETDPSRSTGAKVLGGLDGYIQLGDYSGTLLIQDDHLYAYNGSQLEVLRSGNIWARAVLNGSLFFISPID